MTRIVALALAALALSGVTLALVYGASGSAPGSVYTVPQLRRLIARNRAAWAGRVVAMRGAGVALAWGNVVSLLLCGPSPDARVFEANRGTTSQASVFEGNGVLLSYPPPGRAGYVYSAGPNLR
jgi:hypothetical protein